MPMQAFWQWFKNLNPPVRWLLYFITLVMGLSFWFAPTPQPVDWSKISFHTESSSEIYFHNMRSYYYRIDEREKPPFILYRLKRGGSGALNFMIIENRFGDEAYVFCKWGESIRDLKDPQVFFGNDSIPEKNLSQFNNEDHFRFAARCYRSLLLNEQIIIKDHYNAVNQLFPDKQHQKNALILLEDYFKLVKKNT